jgi:predicted DCC family thiol-disulfide oxidoreductase YuxK
MEFVHYVTVLLIKIDNKKIFKYASLSSKTAAQILDKSDLSRDSVVYYEDSKTHIKSKAVLRILFQLGGGWTLLALCLSIIPTGLRDIFYDFVARNRYQFWGRLDSCRIATPEEKSSFLD